MIRGGAGFVEELQRPARSVSKSLMRIRRTLMECIDHMLKHNVKRVPVMNKENRVVGMLYERDVFYTITKSMLEEK